MSFNIDNFSDKMNGYLQSVEILNNDIEGGEQEVLNDVLLNLNQMARRIREDANEFYSNVDQNHLGDKEMLIMGKIGNIESNIKKLGRDVAEKISSLGNETIPTVSASSRSLQAAAPKREVNPQEFKLAMENLIKIARFTGVPGARINNLKPELESILRKNPNLCSKLAVEGLDDDKYMMAISGFGDDAPRIKENLKIIQGLLKVTYTDFQLTPPNPSSGNARPVTVKAGSAPFALNPKNVDCVINLAPDSVQLENPEGLSYHKFDIEDVSTVTLRSSFLKPDQLENYNEKRQELEDKKKATGGGTISDKEHHQLINQCINQEDQMRYEEALTSMKAEFRSAFNEAMKAINAGDNVLVHCTEGKNRTGAMLTLLIAHCDPSKSFDEAYDKFVRVRGGALNLNTIPITDTFLEFAREIYQELHPS